LWRFQRHIRHASNRRSQLGEVLFDENRMRTGHSQAARMDCTSGRFSFVIGWQVSIAAMQVSAIATVVEGRPAGSEVSGR
jgi:hypothetical protein